MEIISVAIMENRTDYILFNNSTTEFKVLYYQRNID
jgi:hypothetical protein